jgi:YHS domain-containing protein
MKRHIVALAAVVALACSRGEPGRATAPARDAAAPPAAEPATQMQTMDNADMRPAVLDPPPMLTDVGAPTPKLRIDVARPDAPPPPTKADEALRASLPFTPAIAMDPVDGSKISIRTATPMYEYKARIFYFSSEANKRTFANDPETYTKGLFSRL